VERVRRVLLVALVALLAAPAALAATRPLSGPVLLKIDRSAGFRNFLPTRMLPGFSFSGWSNQAGVLQLNFANQAGLVVHWRVEPMTGSCDEGRQGSYQLAGNKVWWAQAGAERRSWRCAFGLDGKPLRLEAASSAPASRLATVGLGVVAASAKRY
jgi:hypothetical protein